MYKCYGFVNKKQGGRIILAIKASSILLSESRHKKKALHTGTRYLFQMLHNFDITSTCQALLITSAFGSNIIIWFHSLRKNVYEHSLMTAFVVSNIL